MVENNNATEVIIDLLATMILEYMTFIKSSCEVAYRGRKRYYIRYMEVYNSNTIANSVFPCRLCINTMTSKWTIHRV